MSLVNTYITASNSYDVDLYLSCFSETATVVDSGEKQNLKGKAAIAAWFSETNEKFKIQTELLTEKREQDHRVLLTKVSGSFPGSPIKFKHVLKTKDEVIEHLEITIEEA